MSKGKNAIVTGSTSGIGLGIAEALAAVGMNVVLNGRSAAEHIEPTRTGLEKEHGVKALYSQANMMKADEIAAMIETTRFELGSVDVVVNNAGIQHVEAIEDFPVEKWDDIIALNLTSAFPATRLAIVEMKRRGWDRHAG